MTELVPQQATQVNPLPAWTHGFIVTRFDAVDMRRTAHRMRFSDFVRAVCSPEKTLARSDPFNQWNENIGALDPQQRREAKIYLPAWSLTSERGTDDSAATGLCQLDFDGVEDPQRLKKELATVTGVIFAALSASGTGVFAILYAPDFDGGVFVGRQIMAEMRRRGIKIEKLDPRCEHIGQLRFESYDPEPFVSPVCEPIAPKYSDVSLFDDIRGATEIWRADEPDFESAATAIAATAIAARARVRYGLPGRERTFLGGCDVQIITESGGCKTQGGVMILRKVAAQAGAREVGGLRATDAAFYEAFIDAAYQKTFDDKGKLEAITQKPYPETCVSILDESGDTEGSRAGNGNKAQANLIRRIACFDQQINMGSTLELQKRYGKIPVPATVPCRLVQYRATTPGQLDNQDIQAALDGGNGRRTIYAESRAVASHFDAADDLDDKFSRIPTDAAQEKLSRLTDCLRELFPADAENGEPATFTASWDDIRTSRQAAKWAFMRANVPENIADTLIYNTALWIAVTRCGLEALNGDPFDPDRQPTRRAITARDIQAATAIALNSWAVAQRLTARSAGARLAAARTQSEKTQLVIEYISGRPGRRIARGNLTRKFGRDVLEVIDGLCSEGVLRVAITKNAEGKNPNTYFEITPDGETQAAADAYAARKGVANRDTAAVKKGVAARLSTAERCDRYLDKVIGSGVTPESCNGNDNFLRSLAGKLKANADLMADADGVEAWFAGQVASGAFDKYGCKAYTQKDARRLFRDGGLKNLA